MVKVSIIIPVYNTGELLYRCLDSVLEQTLQDIEVICVDNGSTDTSVDIIKNYKTKDSRVTLLSTPNIGRQGAARNRGIDIAKGEYLQFVDSDDSIDTESCEKLYKKAEEFKLDFIIGKFRTIYSDGTIRTPKMFENTLINKVISGLNIWNSEPFIPASTCDKLWNRKFFLKHALYNAEGVFHQDAMTTYRGLSVAKKVMLIDYYFYNYYQNSGSTMNPHTIRALHLDSRQKLHEDFLQLIEDKEMWRNTHIITSLMYHIKSFEKISIDDKSLKNRQKDLVRSAKKIIIMHTSFLYYYRVLFHFRVQEYQHRKEQNFFSFLKYIAKLVLGK